MPVDDDLNYHEIDVIRKDVIITKNVKVVVSKGEVVLVVVASMIKEKSHDRVGIKPTEHKEILRIGNVFLIDMRPNVFLDDYRVAHFNGVSRVRGDHPQVYFVVRG